MQTVDTIILGAGPTGLSAAHRLIELGHTSFVVFERESEAGGLCRSRQVDGSPLDIGGGHFLDVRRPAVLECLFRFLPRASWREYDRLSTIQIHGKQIAYPFEANLWQLPIERQLDYLESIARAGCVTGAAMPSGFREWITWKLGDRIAADYMLPYNEKIWSMDLSRLGTYWLHKLPSVSFRETLRSCLERKPSGTMPAHAKFLYPVEGGYGRVWELMGRALGERLLLGRAPRSLDAETLTIDGEFRARRIVTTIPWPEFERIAAVPSAVQEQIGRLEHAPVEVAYRPENLDSAAHWIYVPDPAVPHHRLLLRHNFVPGARGHWTETNARRAGGASGWRHVNEYAYPLNTLAKPTAVQAVTSWAAGKGIVAAGRWGEWEHMNSDVAVEAGWRAAERAVAAG